MHHTLLQHEEVKKPDAVEKEEVAEPSKEIPVEHEVPKEPEVNPEVEAHKKTIEELRQQMQVLHTEHADKVTQLQHDTVTKVKEINDLKSSLDTHGKQIVDLKADLESHGKQIDDLLDQLAKEKTLGATKAQELEKFQTNCQRLKSLIDDQMIIAEKQREKLIASQQEEQRLTKEVSALSAKMVEMEKTEKLQNFQMDRLRKILKNSDPSKKEGTAVKTMAEQLKKLQNENELLRELIKSLKIQATQKDQLSKKAKSIAKEPPGILVND